VIATLFWLRASMLHTSIISFCFYQEMIAGRWWAPSDLRRHPPYYSRMLHGLVDAPSRKHLSTHRCPCSSIRHSWPLYEPLLYMEANSDVARGKYYLLWMQIWFFLY
jgi:hypothetical protein